jgi:hypothetical protein
VRKQAKPLCIALLAGSTLHAGFAGAAAPAGEPVNLSTRDAGQVAAAACTGIGAKGADHIAGSRQRGSRWIHVTVECKPHRTDQSVPVARHTTCDNAQGAWRCDPGREALLVAMPDQSILPVLPDGVTSRTAIEAVREAAKLTIRPFYRPAARVMKGRCTVGETRTASSKGMNSFQIRCGETLIVLTRDCWDGQCRYFIPFAQNY